MNRTHIDVVIVDVYYMYLAPLLARLLTAGVSVLQIQVLKHAFAFVKAFIGFVSV